MTFVSLDNFGNGRNYNYTNVFCNYNMYYGYRGKLY